ncbi:hypothetical protein JZ751_006328 [Albula glossodonta]|uniref:Uncharacterized protein n=1 Tax=Albula glossodonta TaxID=121402 RepID=A0A8T2MTH6_9TELE|nr:hypothetical protein JZ751_006328 [Albula glossodonta]
MVACEVLSYWAIYSPPEKLPPPILRASSPHSNSGCVTMCLHLDLAERHTFLTDVHPPLHRSTDLECDIPLQVTYLYSGSRNPGRVTMFLEFDVAERHAFSTNAHPPLHRSTDLEYGDKLEFGWRFFAQRDWGTLQSGQ